MLRGDTNLNGEGNPTRYAEALQVIPRMKNHEKCLKKRTKKVYVRISCLSPVPNIGNPLFVKSTDSTLGSVRRTWKAKIHL